GDPRDVAGGSPDAVTEPAGCGEDAFGRGGAEHRVPPASILTSPRVSPGGGRLLSERDLLRVAQLLGHEWQEVGVLCLGLRRCRLEQIRENNPHRTALCGFEMLREWRQRAGAAATAAHLRDCLSPAQLDPEVFALLEQL
uniref:Death domain-containing protein n=1 Tax=Phasianus colchicus TaxID=9054 RepID=A0A669QIY0_PHACC